MKHGLTLRKTPGAQVQELPDGTIRLEIPSGRAGVYRLAQLDDYTGLARCAFPWKPPFRMDLEARVSSPNIPGTWGFGLWNNPFSIRLGLELRGLFPALPAAAWFFSASEENYLSFRNDLPAQGFLAQTFRCDERPLWRLAPALALAPFAWIRPAARAFRRILSRAWIGEDSSRLVDIDVSVWHQYGLDWTTERVAFFVDDEPVFSTKTAPHAPLGVVIWIDNQFAAFDPTGRIAFGTLPNASPEWLEIRGLRLEGE